MAEKIVSPGVYTNEIDQSFLPAALGPIGAAIVGPTVKGLVEIPTLVTSFSEYQAAFGTTFLSGSDEYTYLTSISAYNYFQQGGTSLLVSRVTSGSFGPAESTDILNTHVAATNAFTLETISEGEIMNNNDTEGTNHILPNGTSDNYRWQIVNPNTSSGVFSVVIRRGDDNINSQIVLETFTNCSLDPKSDNYS